MSNRNSRVVRNRDKNDNFFNLNFDYKIIVGVIAIILIIVLLIVFVLKIFSSKKNVQISEKKDILYEYFLLSSGEFAGVINKNGETIIESKYLHIDIPNPSKDVFLCYLDNEKCTVLNKENKKILTEYDNISIVESSIENKEIETEVLKYQKDNLFGLIDLDGNILTEAIYDEISSLNYRPGAILIKKDDKYGIIDSKGNTIIEMKYDNISADRIL